MPWLWVISLSPHLLFIVSYHNEHMHFCREMCKFVNTRFLRPYGVITEITTKSPQKLYNGSSFSPHFTQKSSFYPLKSFWPQVLKIRFHLWKHWIDHSKIFFIKKSHLFWENWRTQSWEAEEVQLKETVVEDQSWLLTSGVWKSFWCLGTYNLCLEICVNRDISSKCDIARKLPNLTKILKSAWIATMY